MGHSGDVILWVLSLGELLLFRCVMPGGWRGSIQLVIICFHIHQINQKYFTTKITMQLKHCSHLIAPLSISRPNLRRGHFCLDRHAGKTGATAEITSKAGIFDVSMEWLRAGGGDADENRRGKSTEESRSSPRTHIRRLGMDSGDGDESSWGSKVIG